MFAASANIIARALPERAEGVWKLARSLNEGDVPVDFVEAPRFWTNVAPSASEGVNLRSFGVVCGTI